MANADEDWYIKKQKVFQRKVLPTSLPTSQCIEQTNVACRYCRHVDLPVGQACSACIYLLYFHKSRYSLKCTDEQTLGEDLQPERDKQWFYSAVWIRTSMWGLRGRAVRALDL